MGKVIKHIPVLLNEVIEGLDPQPGQSFIDVTAGYGGHSGAILSKIGERGRLLCLDQDEEAISYLMSNLSSQNVVIEKTNFASLREISEKNSFSLVNGILADLGISSAQIDESQRGFSFRAEAMIDMRMDLGGEKSARDIINDYSEAELERLFFLYGEEKLARLIAREIVARREHSAIRTTIDLANLVSRVYRAKGVKDMHIHPATRVFQALRIEVNQEIETLKAFLPQALSLLAPGGKLAVITFHSLEDRIVKDYFRQESRDCLCPPKFPICKCNHQKTLEIITRKPIIPTEKELVENPRSRSAKLRFIRKI